MPAKSFLLRRGLMAVTIFSLGWLAIFTAIEVFGWSGTWDTLTVPTLLPSFADMRSVQASIDALHHGLDPHTVNPGDPWHRPMDYPLIWSRLAAWLELDVEQHYLGFELLLVAGFLASVGGLLRRAPSAWLVAAAFSSSVLLLVERGNNDLAVFGLLYLAIVTPAALGLGLLFVASLLKLYPVLCWPALVRSGRAAALATVLGFTLLLVMLGELSEIFHAQPLRAYLSYGSASFAFALQKKLHIIVPAYAISGGLVLVAAGVLIALRGPLRFARGEDFDLRRRFFYAGAAVFLGTFVLGSNWDYRLTFLLFCVPLLTAIGSAWQRRAVLACLVLTLNHSALGTWGGIPGYLLNEGAKVVLFVMIIAVAVSVVVQDELVHGLWKRLTLWRLSRSG